jgi:predicted porin
MKKSLFALAALGAFAGAAQAQSSVTLYGTIDTSITTIQNAGLAAGSTAAQAATATPAAGNYTGVVENQIATSLWGLKGEEDLGGGLKAIFNIEGDLNTQNGTVFNNASTGVTQIFRRAANVGLSGSWGEVRIGQQQNPLVAASASMTPVEGNTVNQVRTAMGYSMGDFMSNAISYQTPKISGFQAKVAYSGSGTVDNQTAGSAWAANAFYNNGNLDVLAGYNQQYGLDMGATGTANYNQANLTASTLQGSANGTGLNPYAGAPYDQSSTVGVNNPSKPGNLTGWLAGVKYQVTPTIQASYAFAYADYNAGNSFVGTTAGGPVTVTNASSTVSGTTAAAQTATATVNASTGTTANYAYHTAANIFGIGYKATPSLLLGANYIVTSQASQMYNVQARYSLSKRTTAYFQGTVVSNGNGNRTDVSTKAFGNFIPVQSDTSGNPAAVGGMAALPNTTQSAYGVGIIHSF